MIRMNPSGYRIEEKKSIDPEPSFAEDRGRSFDSKSQASYKSTQSSRSSVLQRAREYSRRIEEQQQRQGTPIRENSHNPDNWKSRRSQSLERKSSAGVSDTYSTSSRSKSASRATQQDFISSGVAGSRPITRERAMASVRKETLSISSHSLPNNNSSHDRKPTSLSNNNSSHERKPTSLSYNNSSHDRKPTLHTPYRNGQATTPPGTPLATRSTGPFSHSPVPRTSPSPNNSRSAPYQQNNRKVTMSADHSNHRNEIGQSSSRGGGGGLNQSRSRNHAGPTSTTRRGLDSPSRSQKSGATTAAQSQPPFDHQQPQQQQPPVVTPELLVDALSGHEDGLLAIAEKLMEHYDAGYDVMGEAIIDAFADVQKLFQHVVEAAHMEGAAFEASRREEEMTELRRQAALGGSVAADLIASGAVDDPALLLSGSNPIDTTLNASRNNTSASPNGPTRHDEFIDQDVKDILTEAIRKGSILRGDNKHKACYDLFERACQDASSLLPVDSDHRGRLQLSLARAESMSPERSCAILRYAMDDVLRSGMRAHRTPLPDPSKRADVVLNRPKGHPSLTGASGQVMSGVIQSSDEALASLMEEMKEILSAPIYDDTPLQSVAKRFWAALTDSQKVQQKNEERLEQSLGKLKVEFLLARAEWEEKLSQSTEMAEAYKDRYRKLKDSKQQEAHLDQARSFVSRMTTDEDHNQNDVGTMYGSVRSGVQGKAGSVVSGVSGLAQQAKTLVSQMNNFNCSTLNERNNGSVVEEEEDYDDEQEDNTTQGTDSFYDSKKKGSKHGKHHLQPPMTQRSQDSNTSTMVSGSDHQRHPMDRARSATKPSRSFREYSRSPKRVDV